MYDRLEDLGADTAEARASHLLSGLQFTHEMQVSFFLHSTSYKSRHHFGKLEPDPYQSENQDPDPLRSQIQELCRLKIEHWRPLDAHSGGVEAQKGPYRTCRDYNVDQ